MKKSKIIVPALAMIGLSAVASVTGSVAWFTAQRTGRITTSDFVVTKIDGDLTLALTNGAGTSCTDDGASHSVGVVSGAKSKDVSFNPVSHQLYDARDNATTFVGIGNTTDYEHAQASHPYLLNGTTYYAFTWKVTISMSDTGLANSAMNVFFDYRPYDGTANVGSKMESSLQDNQTDQDKDTSKGFRIALISTSNTIVYAGLENAAELKAIGEVSTVLGEHAYGTSPVNSGFSYFAYDKYALGSVAAASATAKASYQVAKDSDAQNTQTARADYLGSLVNTNENTRTMDVWCVAWYEGTDSNVVNGATMEKVQASIGFYSTSYTVNA